MRFARLAAIAAPAAVLTSASPAAAQDYTISWFTIDGGGGTSTGGGYTLCGTIGQPDASGPLTGGGFTLEGGFWPGASILGPCTIADVAAPFGTLDIDDVLLFLNAFATLDPIADVSAPTGTFDIDDVLLFLGSFANGCP